MLLAGSAGRQQPSGSARRCCWSRLRPFVWRQLPGPVFWQASPRFHTRWPGGVREVARPLKGQAQESWDVTPTAPRLGGEPRSWGPGPEPVHVWTGAEARARGGGPFVPESVHRPAAALHEPHFFLRKFAMGTLSFLVHRRTVCPPLRLLGVCVPVEVLPLGHTPQLPAHVRATCPRLPAHLNSGLDPRSLRREAPPLPVPPLRLPEGTAAAQEARP